MSDFNVVNAKQRIIMMQSTTNYPFFYPRWSEMSMNFVMTFRDE